MRCVACDAELSDFEATRKYPESKKFVDLCNHCFSTIKDQVNAVERYDLMADADESSEET